MPPNQRDDTDSKPSDVYFSAQDQTDIKEVPQGPPLNKSQGTSSSHTTLSQRLSECSSWITDSLEDIFEWHGRFIATNQIKVIVTCLVITALSAIGLMSFHIELRPYKLWLAQDSKFIQGLEWQFENFPINFRRNYAIWESDNVLKASVIQSMWEMHKRVNSTSDPIYNRKWEDICVRMPSLAERNTNPDDEDVSLLYDREFYCKIIKRFPSKCVENSLLEIWGLEDDIIMNLTDQQVIDDVNEATISRVFGFEVNFKDYLGGIQYDNSGKIIGAKAALHTWTASVNTTMIEEGQSTIDTGTGFEVDVINLSFETSWVENILNKSGLPANTTVYANAASSFGVISENNINSDIPWVALGFSLMFTFVTLAIGKKNSVEQRPFLALAGIFAIGQAVVISYGLCSAFGMFYCPVNSILPVLMVGLGVDDMFVIMSSWESLKAKNLSPRDRLGLTMRQAGVSITVTSITDVVAFAVGSTTSLPALRSFCVFAAVGVMAVYVMQITFFTSFILFDERRIVQKRDGLVPCFVHKNWDPPKWSQTNYIQTFFDNYYIKAILSPIGRAFIMLITAILIAISAYGTSKLHREFDPMWFLPPQSYLSQYNDIQNMYFHENSNLCFIFMSGMNTPDDFINANYLLDTLHQSPYVYETTSLVKDFISYFEMHAGYENDTLNADTFSNILPLFLNSKSGGGYRNSFHFGGELQCNFSAPPIETVRFPIKLVSLKNANDQEKALANIQFILDNFNYSGYINSWGMSYTAWETNEIVGTELQVNLSIVTTIIFLITLILLASLPAALLVLGCVMGTILCITGLMWYWGLTIDTVSCIAIVLSVGLSIDYAVHIAHAYLMSARKQLSTEERVQKALSHVGPAVFLGGTSTLITFLMMAPSTSHVFKTFFKIFVGSATFGLFWGLAVLPVAIIVLTNCTTVVKDFPISNFYKVHNKENELESSKEIGKLNENYTCTES